MKCNSCTFSVIFEMSKLRFQNKISILSTKSQCENARSEFGFPYLRRKCLTSNTVVKSKQFHVNLTNVCVNKLIVLNGVISFNSIYFVTNLGIVSIFVTSLHLEPILEIFGHYRVTQKSEK